MKIDAAEFTIFDVETTGLFPGYGDRICEIAAVRTDASCKRSRKFSSLVDPGRPISRAAFMVNRITDAMVCGRPAIDKVLPHFMEFSRSSVLVAYNAGFDLGFLESALGEDRKLLNDYFIVDALALARRFFPGAPRYSLGILAKHLNIASPVEHRALADAVMTWKVFERELAVMASEGITDVEEIAYARTSMKSVVSEQKELTK